jgi:hypothetical protein
LLLSLACGPLTRRLLGDGGTGWHIRTGQIILCTHAIPRADPFSISTAPKPWYAWEWLYDSALAAVYNLAGLNGVGLLGALLIAATFTVLFRTMLRRGTSVVLAVLLLLAAASASTIHFFARPHVVSWLFTLAWFGLLDSSERLGRMGRLWCLPLLMLVWVNMHGGFLIGFVLLGIYLAGAGWEFLKAGGETERSSSLRRAGTLTWVGLLSVLATFVNPYGYRLHLHIYRYLTNRFLMDHIDEFLAPNFHGIAQQCFAAILLITLLTVMASPRKPRLSELLLVLLAVYSGLLASRNIPVAAMLLVLVSGAMIPAVAGEGARSERVAAWLRSALAREQSFAARMTRLEFGLRGHGWLLAVTALLVWTCLHQGQLGKRRIMDVQFSPTRFPVTAVDYIVEHRIFTPVFSTDAWGGFLIYRLYPHSRVVVDDRHDLYGEAFFKRYLNIVRVQPGWREDLEGMHADWALVPHNAALANILQVAGGWKIAYQDGISILFQRVGTSETKSRPWRRQGSPPPAGSIYRVSMLNPRKALTSMGCSPNLAGTNFQPGSAARTCEVTAAGPGSSTRMLCRTPARSRSQANTMRT